MKPAAEALQERRALQPGAGPCCSVDHYRLARVRDNEAREQQRFERACARELMGEID